MSTDRDRQRDEVKQLLQSRIEALCRELLPDGRRNGGYWHNVRNPGRAKDKKPGSFFVWLTGAPGAWKDMSSGEKGDVFSLIALCEGLDPKKDFGAVMTWARAWLGLDGLSPPERKKRVDDAQRQATATDAERAEREEKARKRAKATYLEAKRRPFVGSPADLYLKGRGIDVERLGRMPGVLGWLPDHTHYETGQTFPVMVAGFTGADGEICAVHRTFLSGAYRNTTAGAVLVWTKAPVTPARKIWPSFGGAAIRLWRGESKLSVDDAVRQGLLETLVLVEGVEDGLSVAMARPDLRIWCAGSLGNLGALTLPACCDRVIVCADNDWGKPQAEKALERAISALVAQGAEVSIARSHIGKDVNDCLRGAA